MAMAELRREGKKEGAVGALGFHRSSEEKMGHRWWRAWGGSFARMKKGSRDIRVPLKVVHV